MSANNNSSGGSIAQNRKARFEYTIEEEIEAGIVLTGTEVKSLRAGQANINDAYAGEKGGAIWLFNAHIAEYAGGNRQNHEVRRPRKLLLHARQIRKLLGRLKVKGVTLVPMALYFNARGMVKVRLALATGRKQYEKRAVKKEQEWKRQQSRLLKSK